MELLYLYIEDDGKNIKDCEFNFSSEYHFSYKRKEKFITVSKNDNYIPNFWDAANIMNVTAIIGKNGTGKSNLLEYITRLYVSSSGLNASQRKKLYIHIYKHKGFLFINRDDIKSNITLYPKHYKNCPLDSLDKNTDTQIIFYSGSFEKNILNDLNHIRAIDISSGSLLREYTKMREYIEKPIKNSGDLRRLQIEDLLRQLELILFSNIDLMDSFTLPYSILLKFSSVEHNKSKENKYYNKFFNKNELYKLTFIELLQNCLLNQLDINEEKLGVEIKSFDNLIKDTQYGSLYAILREYSIHNKIIFTPFPQQLALRGGGHPFMFQILTSDISFEILDAIYSYYFKGNTYFFSPKYLENLVFLDGNMEVSWTGVSAGELEYLTIFSRLYSSMQDITVNRHTKTKNNKTKFDKPQNRIVILDEPANNLHPEWQRRFNDNLFDFLKTVLQGYTFQVIITSHSPILVSDFPKNSIIFLDKNEDGTCKVVDSISRDNTFGANIHTLYRNSFFIKGLPIGEFAKKKINRLFDELENGRIRLTTLKEIQLVGEPLLKDQLMKLYKQYESLPESMHKKIAELEREIETLKRKIDDQD